MTLNLKFNIGDHVVYPAHGVGKLVCIESHEIAGTEIKLLVIDFEREKMTLRIPMTKAYNSGLRALSSIQDMESLLKTLSIKARPKKIMWGRRAQEYENKINSGDLNSLADVLRELYDRNGDIDQSYSERQIYQVALERLTRELTIVAAVDEKSAVQMIEQHLSAA